MPEACLEQKGPHCSPRGFWERGADGRGQVDREGSLGTDPPGVCARPGVGGGIRGWDFLRGLPARAEPVLSGSLPSRLARWARGRAHPSAGLGASGFAFDVLTTAALIERIAKIHG